MKTLLVLTTLVLTLAVSRLAHAQERSAQPDLEIDATASSQVIEAVIKNIRDYYVFPEVAKEVERAVRQHQRSGEYDRIKSAAELAKTLTTQLREITKDKHVSVNYSSKPVPVPREGGKPSDEERQGIRNYGEAINYGFEKVERLQGILVIYV